MTRLTRNETLLLTAALQQGPAALSAWETWRESCLLDDRIDNSSHRMIPLLHQNLCAQGIEHPLMQRYVAVRHFYWFRNRVLMHHAERILSLLQQEDIPTLALKGLSLALETYSSIELRPMRDIDLLVSKNDGLRAINILRSAGLKPRRAKFLARSIDPFRSRYSFEFRIADGMPSVDLHVRLHKNIPSLVLAQRMLNEGRSLKVGAAWTLSAQPTEQVFHLILHSTRIGSQLRWASDIAALIRTRETDIDWFRLSALGEQYSCLALVKESIEDVFAVMGMQPPDDARAVLRGRRISLNDRLEWKLRRHEYFNFRAPFGLWFDYRRLRHAEWECGTAPNGLITFLADCGSDYFKMHFDMPAPLRLWYDYRQVRRGERERGTVPNGLTTFLADRWMLDRKRDVPSKALEKISHLLFGRPESHGPRPPHGKN